RRQDEAILARLGELAEDKQRLDERLAALPQRDRVLDEVEREAAAAENAMAAAGAFASELSARGRTWREADERTRAAVADGRARGAKYQEELAQQTQELDRLRPLAEAKLKGRWWSARWWKATFAGNVPGRVAELESRQEHLQSALATLEEEVRRHEEERAR